MRIKLLSSKVLGLKSIAAAAVAATVAGFAAAPAEAAFVQSGVLTCNVAPSVGLIVTERRDMTCTYQPSAGPAENYSGTLRKIGLTIGVTGGGVIVWGVLQSQNVPVARGALAGNYGGASADASIVVGVGANILVGGSNNTFALQPVSVTGQIGLNFAVGISELVLVPTR